jgi:23S rRNA-/tRNA-specific pseudouridylate synthase
MVKTMQKRPGSNCTKWKDCMYFAVNPLTRVLALLLSLMIIMASRPIPCRRLPSLATAWQSSHQISRRLTSWDPVDGSSARRLFQQKNNKLGSRQKYNSKVPWHYRDIIVRPFGSTVPCWLSQDDPVQTTPIPLAFSSSSWEVSAWAIHVAVDDIAPITATDAITKALDRFQKSNNQLDSQNTIAGQKQYTTSELLELGAVWYLPAQDMNNPFKKPSRLTTADADLLLQNKDYLRIHHSPRRFQAVELYDWSLDGSSTQGTKPPLVVGHDRNKGYLVLNKPSECIPVHETVDNHAENVAACLRRANPDLDYVVTPHRLDQNTSGLITLATSKVFAAYYAQVLRHKTASKLPGNEHDCDANESVVGEAKDQSQYASTKSGIHKAYRCLVCLMPPLLSAEGALSDSWSAEKALQKLQLYAKDRVIIRHYLEPSVRAPKRFVASLPPNAKTTTSTTDRNEAGWAECLLRIVKVGDICALRGNPSSEKLARALWSSSQEIMPPTCQAVVELEVELLTGRTHQIRGQLSVEGFPLVGDVPYGGADPGIASHEGVNGARLALQCCGLKFLDPDLRTTRSSKKGYINEATKMVPSTRWNEYQLDSAWWTPILEQYAESMKYMSDDGMTTLAAFDIGLVGSAQPGKRLARTSISLNPEGLPPQAILSPGRHKYVLVKAIDPQTYSIHKWFVKSASPQECGGPYHKNVAQDLVEWIEACGYRAVTTGGGRILYQQDAKKALVYGFSYGYGRGDHALAAKTIMESSSEIDAAYDDSPQLY